MKGNVARCKLCLGKLKAINEVRCNQMRLHDDSRRGPRTRRWHCTLEILVRWTDCWGGGSASGEARLGEPGQSPHARSWLVSVNERLTGTPIVPGLDDIQGEIKHTCPVSGVGSCGLCIESGADDRAGGGACRGASGGTRGGAALSTA